MKIFEKFNFRNKINNNNYKNLLIKNINYSNISINNDFKNLRIYYFDILRIVSSFSVILIHTSARYYYKLNINSNNWKIAFYYNGIARFGVPVFFMMSGAIFLNKDISFRQMFNKYIKNLLIKLIFWSFIYSIYRVNLTKKNISKIAVAFFSGNYHLWFLDVIIELYLITPFLREIIKKDLLKLFIKLSFIFTFIIPNICKCNSYFPPTISRILENIEKKLDYKYIKGYIFYFMLGNYLNNNNISIYKVIIIYLFGIIGFLFTTKILYKISIIKQQKYIQYFRALNLNILLYSTSIFMFFKLNLNNYKKKQLMKKISNYTFSIYLIHPLILNIFRRIIGDFKSIKLLFSIPLISIIVFILSLIISIFIKSIYFFGKYLI